MITTLLIPEVHGSPHWLTLRSQAPSRPGSILFHAPAQVFQAPGGGENQLVQTGRHLEALDVPVSLFSPWTSRLADARLLHLFGMSREGLELARVAHAQDIPIALSPISWYHPRSLMSLAPNHFAAARSLAGWTLRRLAPRTPSWRRTLIQLASAILPNSHAEASQLVSLFGANPRRIHVVPNGVEPRFAHASPDLFHSLHRTDPFILYVGRIEPRKNVLGLIRSARSAALPLVVIGNAPPGSEPYLAACRAAGLNHVRFIKAIPHDHPLLASAYAASRAFALPSWFETPGLALLEAALAGKPLVATPYGSAPEYFGNLALYARPDHPSEIVRALAQAYESTPDPRLPRHVQSHYLWSQVARKTAEVYDQVAG